ncbi:hypothetical protein YC2023_123962 [Brassica napus]
METVMNMFACSPYQTIYSLPPPQIFFFFFFELYTVSPKASQAQGTNLCRCGPNVKFRSGRESKPGGGTHSCEPFTTRARCPGSQISFPRPTVQLTTTTPSHISGYPKPDPTKPRVT